jgi:hypothetical protein
MPSQPAIRSSRGDEEECDAVRSVSVGDVYSGSLDAVAGADRATLSKVGRKAGRAPTPLGTMVLCTFSRAGTR